MKNEAKRQVRKKEEWTPHKELDSIDFADFGKGFQYEFLTGKLSELSFNTWPKEYSVWFI